MLDSLRFHSAISARHATAPVPFQFVLCRLIPEPRRVTHASQPGEVLIVIPPRVPEPPDGFRVCSSCGYITRGKVFADVAIVHAAGKNSRPGSTPKPMN